MFIVLYSYYYFLIFLKIIITKIKNKDLYDMISEIRNSDKSYELVLVNGIKIITDTLVNEDKYNKAYQLYNKIKGDKVIQYIDIRFKYFNVK